MKKFFIGALAVLGMTACGGAKENKETVAETATAAEQEVQEVLVAYFSATGTTKATAEAIAEETGGTLFEIVPETLYTDADLDWRDENSRSTIEMHDPSSRPAIKGDEIPELAEYDVVFIGYPNWWNLAPTVINTFIETYDLKGKKLVPFSTSGGSGIENSVAHLAETYPDLDWVKDSPLNNPSAEQIAEYVKTLGL